MNTFTYKGFTFQLEKQADDSQEMPWERSDMHGPVRYVRSNYSKKPGERFLSGNGNTGGYLYDWQEAVKIARHVWGHKTKLSACQAVEQDFNYLKSFLCGDWTYIGIKVCLVLNGEPVQATSASLYGIESFAGYIIREYAHDLAEESLQLAQELKTALDREFPA